MPGPRPKPTALRVLQGNPSRRPLPQGEPQPSREMPDPPTFLGMVGMQEWARVAGELHRIGVLTSVDRAVMAAYCKFYERWAVAEAKIIELGETTTTPSGYVVQSAYIGMANRAAELMLKYAQELGLTPAARVKLAKGPAQPDDELEAFLAGGKKAKR